MKTSFRKVRVAKVRPRAVPAVSLRGCRRVEHPECRPLRCFRSAISTAPLSSAPPLVSTLPASGPAGQSQLLIPPTASSTPASTVFTLHHVPEDQDGASKEAMIQAGLVMDRLKVVYDTSKAAYDASSALQANVRVSGIVS